MTAAAAAAARGLSGDRCSVNLNTRHHSFYMYTRLVKRSSLVLAIAFLKARAQRHN